MPMIPDASQSKLTALVHQLELNRSSPDKTKELRSTGKDLYIKSGHASGPSSKNRTDHRANAIGLVRGAIAAEFHCKPEDVEQIMKSMFGEVPAKLTADMTRRVYETAAFARTSLKNNVPINETFRLVQPLSTRYAAKIDDLVKRFREQDLTEQEAFESACVVISRMGASESDFEGVLLGKKFVEGKLNLLATTSTVSADNSLRFAFIDAVANSMRGLPRYEACSDTEKAQWANIALAIGSPALVRPPDDVNLFALDAGDKESLSRAVLDAVQKLPAYENAYATEKTAWLAFANVCAMPDFVSVKGARSLDTGIKTSLHEALSDWWDEVKHQRDPSPSEAAFRSLAGFGLIVGIGDVTTADDLSNMESFLKICSEDPVVQDAKSRWPKMDLPERKLAVERIIALHAKYFGYVVPENYVAFVQIEKSDFGALSPNGKTLSINSDHTDFNDFASVFNCVSHESAHKFQESLAAQVDGKHITANSPDYDRARLIKASRKAHVPGPRGIIARLRWSYEKAYDAYRQSPLEQHAHYLGDYAENRARERDQ